MRSVVDRNVVMRRMTILLRVLLRARLLKLRKHLSHEGLLCNPKLSSAQIQYPCVSYKETEVPECGCAYIFWFKKRCPKNIIALSSQCLAAASNMLHCLSLHLAESAGWISTEQAHSSQMSYHWSMSSESCNCFI
jgi:hypothetical protein